MVKIKEALSTIPVVDRLYTRRQVRLTLSQIDHLAEQLGYSPLTEEQSLQHLKELMGHTAETLERRIAELSGVGNRH